MVFKLAHLSDIHLAPLPDFPKSRLLSKRITGYLNWLRNRSHSLNDNTLSALVAHMQSQRPDHIAVTGDLINLALPEEYEPARQWLLTLGPAKNVSFTPGNHDTYVPGAFDEICSHWAPNMLGDGQSEVHFPYCRIRDGVAIVGANSGRASLPFMATGVFDSDQAHRLKSLLQALGQDDLFRVVLIHHPPFANATHHHKRLIGDDLFREVISATGAELILHGHTHIDSIQSIEGPDGPVPVIGVPSASQRWQQDHPHGKPAGRYNLFSIDTGGKQNTLKMQEFGYLKNDNEIELISERYLSGAAGN